jgi:hypothetical protein
MNYQKSGIIIFKKKENKYYFLLGKNNLNLLNSKNNLFSDIGGLKGNNDFNAKDTASRLFYENTCGLLFSINELKDKIMGSFDNPKYNYTLNFIHSNIDDNILHNINQIRSYLNTVIQSNGFNTFEKKEITLQGCNFSNDIRWFELNEILNNSSQFDSQFINTFLKCLKTDILKKN